VIVVKISSNGLLSCGQMQFRQITNRNIIWKLSIVVPLSKNKNSDELAFKHRQGLDKTDEFSSQKHINKTQILTKIDRIPPEGTNPLTNSIAHTHSYNKL